MKFKNDTERLNWLGKQDGLNLVSDDFGNWAVSTMGIQDVPTDPIPKRGKSADIWLSTFVEAKQWQPSIRRAIDAAAADD